MNYRVIITFTDGSQRAVTLTSTASRFFTQVENQAEYGISSVRFDETRV